MKRIAVVGVLGLAVLGCEDTNGPSSLPAPQNLFYVLEASGDPEAPAGVLLEWDAVNASNLQVYNVYSSLDGTNFDLRGSTTSLTFHDGGQPDVEYFVTAVDTDGDESPDSDHVIIDEFLRLESPTALASISLDGAVHLLWTDNPFETEPEGFRRYRVYSTDYSLDEDLCGATWVLEGTTIGPEFISSPLPNGLPFCFAVSAESIEGWESLWSPLRADTPRPDARNVLVWNTVANPSLSGFRFFLDANGDGVAADTELGLVTSSTDPIIDFQVVENGGIMTLQPVRAGVTVALYSNQPISDLTDIDIAPLAGFAATGIEASPGFGYVFQMQEADGFFRYGGLRVQHVGVDFIIFDWSYQTDPGNPELSRHGGRPTAPDHELIVTGVKR